MAAAHSPLSSLSANLQLIAVYFLCASLLTLVDAQNRSDEVRALLDFQGQVNYNADWPYLEAYFNTWNESDENPCAWVGVTCSFNFTVEELDLSGWGIASIALQPLSFLRDLSRLDLSSNFLVDTLDFVDTLPGLTWLDVSQNNLVGKIPANISACRRLRFLSLGQNTLNGTIPSTLGDLKELQFLLLGNNQLSGPIPKEMGELSNFIKVDLSNNLLTGSIPALSNSSYLVELTLDNNFFTQFESSWFSTGSQGPQILTASSNQLEGLLPSIINISQLEVFSLSANRLSGHLPSFPHAGFYNTFTLDLSQNNFTGEIPVDFLSRPTLGPVYWNIRSVNLSNNSLTGNVQLDRSFPYFSHSLDLSYNNLSGLSLSFNNLSGLSLNGSSSIYVENLYVGNNQLSGDIVDFLFGPIITKIIGMENNLLIGDLSRLADMTITPSRRFPYSVDLSNNNLHWSISEAIPDPITATLLRLTTISQMTQFVVGGNNFSGTPLPSACFVSLSNSSQFGVLDFSNSHLGGQILSTVFNSTCLPTLNFLNLSNNDITGLVPDSIFKLPQLEVLNLSNNRLSGQLPQILSSSGFYNPSIFIGNEGLCGYPLDLCPQPSQARDLQWWVLLIIISGCVIIAVGSCLVATWRWRVYHKRHQQDADLIRTLEQRESATLVSLQELKNATENFSASAQIGEGGFGTVYIGKLNGTIVAIKRSKREGSEADKEQFLNEVRILSQVNHRNLVKLLGCCMENKIAVLVFEFISNGTLQGHLRGKPGGICLTWEQRLKIAVQTADALNYLHSGAMYPIYHRDVKSTNILLDDNLDAKVADFGISKLAPLNVTHVSTIPLQGTIGYIDPEYFTTCHLTDKSDVYSFGVVLLELISAKSALDLLRGGNETSLVYFARPYIESEDLAGLIDPALSRTYNDLVGNGRDSIMRVGKLALKCLQMRSKARPTMREILKELQSLHAKLNSPSEERLDEFITENDNEDLQPVEKVLSHVLSGNSSRFVTQYGASGIEMSNFSGPSPTARFRSKSMRSDDDMI